MASPTTVRSKQKEPPTERSAERVTVALTSRVSHDLDQLRTMTGLSKTDLVNRALSLYLFVEQLRQQNKQLAVYDPERSDVQPIHIT